MKGKHILYSEQELAWIRENATRLRREAHAEFCRRFDRSDVSLRNYSNLCLRNRWMTGRAGPGKGAAFPWLYKKGHIPHRKKYLGHENIRPDGYVDINVSKIGVKRRYVLKHKYLWERQHGPVPKGMCLKCLDGNKQNTDPSNWELIPLSLRLRLNTLRGIDYAAAEPEVKPAIMALARIKDRAAAARRDRRTGQVGERACRPQPAKSAKGGT